MYDELDIGLAGLIAGKHISRKRGDDDIARIAEEGVEPVPSDSRPNN